MRDVAVIGGSAAGLFTAFLLARRDLPVRVYEGTSELDPLPRTLIVTSLLKALLGSTADSSVLNEIRRFELYTDGRVATVSLQRPDLVIERSILIRELARQAEQAGARLLLGRRFVGLQPDGKGLQVAIARGEAGVIEEVRVRTVIGADGAFSAVAKAAGWPRQATVPLVQASVRLPAGTRTDTTKVWFRPEDTPYFYWLIPESPSHGVLGLIGENGSATRRALESFLEKQRLDPIDFQGARISLYTPWTPFRRRVGDADVYLVGDAGGHVKVTTVGGIVTGFRGALGVAEAILTGGSSRELRALRRELEFHLLIRRTLHRFGQSEYSLLLDMLNAGTQRLLGLYSRDDAAAMLGQMCLRQPRLLLLALRGILAGGRTPPAAAS